MRAENQSEDCVKSKENYQHVIAAAKYLFNH